ncbi:hypothetical protein GCM10011409_07720 [Lentibacillus populi]|uniref:Uncharacterized protein n=1 Tax=Lentibacillus populi TaxID=1827502 RepID=A0A9W5TV86_9BACI|nr:hypothetical protein [Lentibacillus populi]GGB32753.1 hypothetical protein GCM10011409_07720 [Lentibacillus populi]
MPDQRKSITKRKSRIWLRSLTIVYLMFLIVHVLTSPTNAYFTDTASYDEKLQMKDEFNGGDPTEQQTTESTNNKVDEPKESQKETVDKKDNQQVTKNQERQVEKDNATKESRNLSERTDTPEQEKAEETNENPDSSASKTNVEEDLETNN